MPSLSGGPNRAFPTVRDTINPQILGGGETSPALAPVIPPTQSGIASAASFDFKAGPFKATDLILDIPSGILCTVEVNGAVVVKVSDGNGLQTSLPYGDVETGISTTITVRITGTSVAAAVRDVRAWVAVLP